MDYIQQKLTQASQVLANAEFIGQAEALVDARLLLQHTLRVSHAWLIAHMDDVITDAQSETFQQLLSRRLAGEPIAYILGMREFYGLPLKTTPATLIPRPDTETLVEAALAKVSQHESLKVLDLGTGTGAIALAIAQNRPNAQVTAVDFSTEALSVAQENAQNLGLVRVRLMQSDWFASLQGEKFDVIVSNPPYIAENDEHLKQGDLRFEPITALASGEDGLNDIRRIIQEASNYLNPHGWLMLEHGYDQAEKVAALLKQHGFSQVNHAPDLSGILRVTFGTMS